MRRFYRRLANRLGYASLTRFLGDCTVEDLVEQLALYHLEPWGEEREDIRMARMASAICNSLGNKTKPQDFIFDFEKAAMPEKLDTPNDIARKLIAAGYPVVLGKRE